MQYIHTGENEWVEVDRKAGRTRLILKTDIEKQIEELTHESENLDKSTDEELLAWAKVNFPYSKEAEKYRSLVQSILEKQELLTKLQ